MAKNDLKITGLAELHKAVQDLTKATQKKVLRSTARQALKIYTKEAQQNANTFKEGYSEGNLKDSMGIISAKRQGRDKVTMIAGPRRKKGKFNGYHAHLLEFGTVKMPAQPFLTPAWDATDKEVLDKYKDEMWSQIKKQLKKGNK